MIELLLAGLMVVERPKPPPPPPRPLSRYEQCIRDHPGNTFCSFFDQRPDAWKRGA